MKLFKSENETLDAGRQKTKKKSFKTLRKKAK